MNNKKNLILQSTSSAQWLKLIQDAQRQQGIQLNDNLEHYLLMTLENTKELNNRSTQPLGVRYLESFNLTHHLSYLRFRELGDECLLLSGLFPHVANKKNVDLHYFISIGKQSYQQIAHYGLQGKLNINTDLFKELSLHFVGLMDILVAMRR